jgi:SAM-dependent methyltransferase
MAAGLLTATGNAAPDITKLAATRLDLKILDTDPIGILARHLSGKSFYTSTIYLPDQPFGSEVRPGLWNADLAALPFEDNSFDIIMTSDVMEHVRQDRAAHLEIHRCLRAGGVYVFTVPFVPSWTDRQILVDASGPEDVYLCPPQYHGDPLEPEKGILVYRIYGRDLIHELREIGFDVEVRVGTMSALGVIHADLWLCRKIS